MVPLWLVNEVSARAIKTYCALFSFMKYRECYDKTAQTWGRPFAVISAHQAAERQGCSRATFWRGNRELVAAGAVEVSPQYGVG